MLKGAPINTFRENVVELHIDEHLAKITQQLSFMQHEINQLHEMIEIILQNKESLGDWINEETTMRLTGCKKTKLYYMRREGKIIGVPFDERKMFYRRKSLAEWLDIKERQDRDKPLKR